MLVSKQNEQYQTIQGRPLAAEQTFARYTGGISVVIDNNGKTILANGYVSTSGISSDYERFRTLTGVSSLVNKDVADNDLDVVKIVGKYEGQTFRMYSLDVEGYHFEFDK